MFPVGFVMFPLAPIPAVHAAVLRVDVNVVFVTLVAAIAVVVASITHDVRRFTSRRRSNPVVAMRRRALRVAREKIS